MGVSARSSGLLSCDSDLDCLKVVKGIGDSCSLCGGENNCISSVGKRCMQVMNAVNFV